MHYSLVVVTEIPINLSQYSEESVTRVDFTDNLELLKFLQSKDNDVKFKKWGNNNIERSMDIQINQDNLNNLKLQFPELNYKIVVDDLSQKVYESFPRDYRPLPGVATVDSNSYENNVTNIYRPLGTINAWVDLIAEKYPDLITIEDIGQTYEHRTYRAVPLSVPNYDVDHSERKTIVITGGAHSREWISVSSVLYAHTMIKVYEENSGDSTFAKLDFLSVPVSNPNGYAYTWTNDRLWRKNRQETTVPRCFGIDIHHSFNFHWNPSTGHVVKSTVERVPLRSESRIWNEYLNQTNHNHHIYGYIDLHSYVQQVLFPYAYSCDKSPRDEENLIELAYGISKAIRKVQ